MQLVVVVGLVEQRASIMDLPIHGEEMRMHIGGLGGILREHSDPEGIEVFVDVGGGGGLWLEIWGELVDGCWHHRGRWLLHH